MILEVRHVPPFDKNGFVVGCPETREGVVIDPGDEVDELLEVVRRRDLTVKYILLTHAHMDHITGVGRAKAALDVPVGLHRADEFLYKAAVQQGIGFGFKVEQQPPLDFYLEDGGPWRFGRYGAWVQPHARALAGRRLPGDRTGRRAGSHALRRRYAVCRRDRAHGSARRQPGDAAVVDPERAVQFPGRLDRLARTRRADDDRSRTSNESVPDLIGRGWTSRLAHCTK